MCFELGEGSLCVGEGNCCVDRDDDGSVDEGGGGGEGDEEQIVGVDFTRNLVDDLVGDLAVGEVGGFADKVGDLVAEP